MRMILSISFIFGLGLTRVEAFGCPAMQFSTASQILENKKTLVLVTHPSSEFDASKAAKSGIDKLVAFAKGQSFTTIYLQNNSFSETYPDDCRPNHWVYSAAGESNFQVKATEVYFVGGFWELCQDSTLSDVLRSWADFEPPTIRIIQVMDAIYVSGNEVYPWDEFYSRYKSLLDTKPKPKLPDLPTANLSELLGIMKNEAQQIDFLLRRLPNFGYLPDDYSIELYFKNRFVRTLRNSKNSLSQKRLEIRFVDTAN